MWCWMAASSRLSTTDGNPVKPERMAKPARDARADVAPPGRARDQLLRRSASVVLGQRRQGHGQRQARLSRGFAHPQPQGSASRPERTLAEQLNAELRATVHDVIRLTPNIVEVIVKAPMAARAFQPGQFYRLQNFEIAAPRTISDTRACDGRAWRLPAPLWIASEGLLSTIVLEMGGSSDLCALLKPGEPVILMGPTGTPTETPSEETALLVGGGLGNAVLFSIGQTLRASGSRVIYFAGYKKMIDRYKVEEIEKAADVVIWCCDEAPGFTPGRSQDRSFVGNIVQAMVAYASGELGDVDDSVQRGATASSRSAPTG